MGTDPDSAAELKKKIELLETRVKHLSNELFLTKEEHEEIRNGAEIT